MSGRAWTATTSVGDQNRCGGARSVARLEFGVAPVLVPPVHDVVHDGDVTLRRVADLAEHGVPVPSPDHCRDLPGVRGPGAGDGLTPDLKRGIAVKCVAVRIDALVLELLEDRGRRRLLPRIRRKGEQR